MEAGGGGEAARQLQQLLFSSMEQCARHAATAESLRAELGHVSSERDEAVAAKSELQQMVQRLRDQIALMQKQHAMLQGELQELQVKAQRQIKGTRPPLHPDQAGIRRGVTTSEALPPPAPARMVGSSDGADASVMAQLGSRREKMARVYRETAERQQAALHHLATFQRDVASGHNAGAFTHLPPNVRFLPRGGGGGSGQMSTTSDGQATATSLEGSGAGGMASSLISCDVPTTDSDGGGGGGGGEDVGSYFGPWLAEGGASAGTSQHGDDVMMEDGDGDSGSYAYEEGGDEEEAQSDPGMEANPEFSFFGHLGGIGPVVVFAGQPQINPKYPEEDGDEAAAGDSDSAAKASASRRSRGDDVQRPGRQIPTRVPSDVIRRAEEYAGESQIRIEKDLVVPYPSASPPCQTPIPNPLPTLSAMSVFHFTQATKALLGPAAQLRRACGPAWRRRSRRRCSPWPSATQARREGPEAGRDRPYRRA